MSGILSVRYNECQVSGDLRSGLSSVLCVKCRECCMSNVLIRLVGGGQYKLVDQKRVGYLPCVSSGSCSPGHGLTMLPPPPTPPPSPPPTPPTPYLPNHHHYNHHIKSLRNILIALTSHNWLSC